MYFMTRFGKIKKLNLQNYLNKQGGIPEEIKKQINDHGIFDTAEEGKEYLKRLHKMNIQCEVFLGNPFIRMLRNNTYYSQFHGLKDGLNLAVNELIKVK